MTSTNMREWHASDERDPVEADKKVCGSGCYSPKWAVRGSSVEDGTERQRDLGPDDSDINKGHVTRDLKRTCLQADSIARRYCTINHIPRA